MSPPGVSSTGSREHRRSRGRWPTHCLPTRCALARPQDRRVTAGTYKPLGKGLGREQEPSSPPAASQRASHSPPLICALSCREAAGKREKNQREEECGDVTNPPHSPSGPAEPRFRFRNTSYPRKGLLSPPTASSVVRGQAPVPRPRERTGPRGGARAMVSKLRVKSTQP